jgi:UDP-glucuronate 4-epimerase
MGRRASFSVLNLLGLILIVAALGRLSSIPDVAWHTRENELHAVWPTFLVHPQESYKYNPHLLMTPRRLAALRGPEGPKFTVLVTGAAGFVGMHTAMELKRLGMTPIGYDNVNAYYSTDLKESRVAELQRRDITFVRGDVCDWDLLTQTIRKHNVTRFIHLAAQAGVRYSLDHPLEYTRNNVDCTVKLLEVMVELGLTNAGSLVYASSSSVYGNNVKVPFHETDLVEDPASLYAATKRSDELIAHTYYNLYNITSIGLRFFTVYGPYGRPDMAPWIFTDKISNNETIQVFNHGKSHRDFTYIDDIVQGVVNSLFVETGQPELINLGNGRPVLLADFVRIVEDNVGWSAQTESLGMQKGDVPKTYADIRKARYLLGYDPSTPIETGITNFVAWFKEHRASQYRMGKATDTATTRSTTATTAT